MAQFLRPDGNVTQSSFTGGAAEIDEATASDVDYAYGANNTAAVLETSTSNPSGTPSGTCTARYRIAKTNNGTVDGTGNAVTVTGEVYEGANQIATDSARTANGTWTEYSFTFAASAVTDWTNVRLRFTTSTSGGSPANRRGGAVSWAEIETPDAATNIAVSPVVAKLLAVAPAVSASVAVALAPVLAKLLAAAPAVQVGGSGQQVNVSPVTARLSAAPPTVQSSVVVGVPPASCRLLAVAPAVIGSVVVPVTPSMARLLAIAPAVSGGEGGGGNSYCTTTLSFRCD